MTDINIQDLKSQIKSDEEINKQYTDLNGQLKNPDELKKYPAFDTTSEKLNNEEFKSLEINGIKKRITLEVSNLGRLKYNGEILHQVEEVKNSCNDNKTIKGYLQIDKEKHKELWDEIPTSQYKYVYQLVAKVWCNKEPKLCPKCEKCPIEIHHKDNDGYNNSAANLTYLTKCEHREVHAK